MAATFQAGAVPLRKEPRTRQRQFYQACPRSQGSSTQKTIMWCYYSATFQLVKWKVPEHIASSIKDRKSTEAQD